VKEKSGVVFEIVADDTDELKIDVVGSAITDVHRKQLHKSVSTIGGYFLLKP